MRAFRSILSRQLCVTLALAVSLMLTAGSVFQFHSHHHCSHSHTLHACLSVFTGGESHSHVNDCHRHCDSHSGEKCPGESCAFHPVDSEVDTHRSIAFVPQIQPSVPDISFLTKDEAASAPLDLYLTDIIRGSCMVAGLPDGYLCATALRGPPMV